MDLKNYIANVYDFPKEGIIFRDITPVLQNPEAFNYVIAEFVKYAKEVGATKIVGPEARGFLFGAPVACELKLPFIPIRKPGKLPRKQITEEYELEYGKNTLCIHDDAVENGDKILIVDDLLATGGTALAAAHLCEKCGAEVVGFSFVIDLIDLKGRKTLKDYNVKTLVEFDGE